MDVDVTLDMLRTIEIQAPQLLDMYKQQAASLCFVGRSWGVINYKSYYWSVYFC